VVKGRNSRVVHARISDDLSNDNANKVDHNILDLNFFFRQNSPVCHTASIHQLGISSAMLFPFITEFAVRITSIILQGFLR
jgi:hypothetical protein